MRNVKHHDIRFAGNTIEDLHRICAEYDHWEETGVIDDDALLREKGKMFAPGNVHAGCLAAALSAFREMAKRAGIY